MRDSRQHRVEKCAVNRSGCSIIEDTGDATHG
jgi:hypothetical protein